MPTTSEDLTTLRRAGVWIIATGAANFLWCIAGFVTTIWCGVGGCFLFGGVLSLAQMALGAAHLFGDDDRVRDAGAIILSPGCSMLCLNPFTFVFDVLRHGAMAEVRERLDAGGLDAETLEKLPRDARGFFSDDEEGSLWLDEEADLVVEALAQSERADDVTTLHFSHRHPLSPASIRQLAELPLPRLRALWLEGEWCDDAMLSDLSGAPWVAHLERVGLDRMGRPFGEGAAALLARMPRLEHLSADADLLAAVGSVPETESLQLREGSQPNVQTVLDGLKSVEELSVYVDDVTVEWPSLAGLHRLSTGVPLGPSGRALLRAATKLGELKLQLGPEDAADPALFEDLGQLSELTELDLFFRDGSWKVGREHAAAMLSAGRLPKLVDLELYIPEEATWSDDLLEAIVARANTLEYLRLRSAAVPLTALQRLVDAQVRIKVWVEPELLLEAAAWREQRPDWSVRVLFRWTFPGQLPFEHVDLDEADITFSRSSIDGVVVYLPDVAGLCGPDDRGLKLEHRGSTSHHSIGRREREAGLHYTDVAAYGPRHVAVRLSTGEVELATYTKGTSRSLVATREVPPGRLISDPARNRALALHPEGVFVIDRVDAKPWPGKLPVAGLCAVAGAGQDGLFVQHGDGRFERLEGGDTVALGEGPACEWLEEAPEGPWLLGWGEAGVVLVSTDGSAAPVVVSTQPAKLASWQEDGQGWVQVHRDGGLQLRALTAPEDVAQEAEAGQAITAAVRLDDATVVLYGDTGRAFVRLHELLR